MARVVEPAVTREETARVEHRCGALIEFTKSDLREGSGSYEDGKRLWCPACRTSPLIGVERLKWQAPARRSPRR